MSTSSIVRDELLEVCDLSVAFGHGERVNTVVRNVSFTLAPGEKLALVGESGSGKSVTALSILRLLDPKSVIYPTGTISFRGESLLDAPEGTLRRVRGKDIAMIFQEPMTSLNPVFTIGDQLVEPLVVHEGLSRAAARKRMIDLLDRTGIPHPHKRIDSYPHMLSGGQRQRVMIAMALACNPNVLIADEPTTALDVTVQLQILELLEALQREFNMAVMMITHDLNLVRRFADRICVMQTGRIVEQADVETVFRGPKHPYTTHLLQSQPERIIDESKAASVGGGVLLEGRHLQRTFMLKSGFFRRAVNKVKAVDNVDIVLRAGETLGVVGESGSGKSTLGMCLWRLQPCCGEVRYDNQRIDGLKVREISRLRRYFQVVFQDPYSSLAPRMNIEQIIGEGLRIHASELTKIQRRDRVIRVLEEVGLEANMLSRYPHEFSGGQRQRIAIARAIILEPKIVLLDEPTSALDVSVQKQVLSLLRNLQVQRKMSYLFITHDLKVIRAIAHRIIVMRHGRIVEQGTTEALFNSPSDEYTKGLLRASFFTNESDATR